jgi:hypothetical protein
VITPESLEAQFINKGSRLGAFYGNLKCVVIDKFHAFSIAPAAINYSRSLIVSRVWSPSDEFHVLHCQQHSMKRPGAKSGSNSGLKHQAP